MENLNELSISTDNGVVGLTDHNTLMKNLAFDKVEVYFKNLEKALIQKIVDNSDGFIFGSVAWLTSESIIDALSKCDNVQILIQKEDFLRPDYCDNANEKQRRTKYRRLYAKLKFIHDRYDCVEPICNLSVCGDPTVDPVRCVGNFNFGQKKAMPRAHNKFLVFCKQVKVSTSGTRQNKEIIYKSVAVWTGSFNFTANAERSFENAIYLEDTSGGNPIINSYLKEHHQIFALSEPLDWEHEWSEPEYRIGT
jgi:hypothetical protein